MSRKSAIYKPINNENALLRTYIILNSLVEILIRGLEEIMLLFYFKE